MYQRPVKKSQLQATAYHESGHAVLSVYFQWKLRRVSIVSEAGRHGFVSHYLRKSIENPDWDGDYSALGRKIPIIITALGGIVSQRRFRRASVRSYHPQGDFQKVADNALSLCCGCEKETNLLLKWLVAHTERKVELLWPAICRFADVLLPRRVIDGREATKIIRESLGLQSTKAHVYRTWTRGIQNRNGASNSKDSSTPLWLRFFWTSKKISKNS